MPQDLIAGRYRVDRSIGKGGMGTVWLCRDEVLHRNVAVKQIGTIDGESPGDTRRAMREARAAASLNHRNVVSIYDIVEEQGAPWLVMEYVPSQTLSELMRDGPLPVERVAGIGAQVATALAAAHAAGIIHRDVKPSNILVGEDDQAKISDFGIAHLVHDERLTRTGMTSGTPTYFSPELARGADPSPASDAWALGATLYAAVEGRPPHPARPNPLATLQVIATSPVKRPVRAGPLLDPIGHLMDPDPDARWGMAEAAEALRRAADRQVTGTLPAVPTPSPAPPVTDDPPEQPERPEQSEQPERPDRERSGSRFFPIALVLAAVLLVVIGVAVVSQLLGAEEPQDEAGPETESSASATRSTQVSASGEVSTSDSSQPSETTSAPTDEDPSDGPSTTTPPDGSPAARVQAVATYFETVPGDLDAGWALLAPSFQREVGRDSYDGFWATISSVDATDLEAVGSDSVSARITYRGTDGSLSTEQQVLTLVLGSDGYLIAGDR